VGHSWSQCVIKLAWPLYYHVRPPVVRVHTRQFRLSVSRAGHHRPPAPSPFSFSTPLSLSPPPIGFVTAMSRGHWSANSQPFQLERTKYSFFSLLSQVKIYVHGVLISWNKVAKLWMRQNQIILNLMKHIFYLPQNFINILKSKKFYFKINVFLFILKEISNIFFSQRDVRFTPYFTIQIDL